MEKDKLLDDDVEPATIKNPNSYEKPHSISRVALNTSIAVLVLSICLNVILASRLSWQPPRASTRSEHGQSVVTTAPDKRQLIRA